MATLTTEQQQDLWDNRFESNKCYNDNTTQDASTYHCYRFASNLDGHNYYVVLESPDAEHSSDAAAIEAAVKSELSAMEYKEPIGHSTLMV
jgi:hypothetical protein